MVSANEGLTGKGRELGKYTVEFYYRGELLPEVIDLQDFSEADACRRGRNAMFMLALRDGREYELDQIEARIYQGDADGALYEEEEA